MADHDQIYDDDRAGRLQALLRRLAARIQELDRAGRLFAGVPELLRLLGEARSELFHYEVRSTYDSPEAAEHRRIVHEATEPELFDEPEDDEPWRRKTGD